MNPAIAFKVLYVAFALIMPTSVLPIASKKDISSLVGTTTTWNVYSDLDDFKNGSLRMENVTATTDLVLTENDLTCTVTFHDLVLDAFVSYTNSNASWNGVLLVASHNDSDVHDVGGYDGVTRQTRVRSCSIGARDLFAGYDNDTGLLLVIYNLTMSETGTKIYKNYLVLENTDAFFTSGDITPYLIFIAIGGVAIALVYTVTVSLRDNKLRKSKACFGEGCWD